MRDERPTAAAPPTGLRLRIETGPDAGALLEVAGGPQRAGRAEYCEVRLRDADDPPRISREHALLEPGPEGLLVRDRSLNGTWVGSRGLSPGESALLRPGERLRLGPRFTLALECGAAAAPDGPRITGGRSCLRRALCGRETLEAAWRRVRLNAGAPGVDGVSVEEFAATAAPRLLLLRQDLLDGRYRALPPRRFAIPKRRGGARVISILTVQDRVVQHALHAVLQPLLERCIAPCAYAYRPGRSAHDALRAVDAELRRGAQWVAESDVEAFFDRVEHGRLLEALAREVGDAFAMELASHCLSVHAPEPALGLAQGAACSPLYSNLYLADWDRRLLAGGFPLVRYGDDFVAPTQRRGEAQAMLAEAEAGLRALGLSLRPDRTAVTPVGAGVTFLGYRFTRSGLTPSPEARERLEEKLEHAGLGKERAIRAGWNTYFGGPGPAASPPQNEDDPAALAAALLAALPVRRSAFARLEERDGRRHFVPCAGTLSAEQAAAHARGEEALAGYLHQEDDRVQAIVLDLDAAPERGPAPSRPATPVELAPVLVAMGAILCRARQAGIPVLAADSGRRGRHLWITLDRPVQADLARKLGRALLRASGALPAGVRAEVFPRAPAWEGELLGDAARLPLGRHPLTGRQCPLLDEAGDPAEEPQALLRAHRPLPADQLPALLTKLRAVPAEGNAADGVAELRRRCAVVRAIERRAEESGHLRHVHNLILLYTAGRLGAEGHAYVHAVIGQTETYRRDLCQRYLDGLDTERRPLSCARVREWLEETGEADWCACPSTRRSPLGETTERRRPAPPQRQAPEACIEWEAVSADLFGGTEDSETEGGER